jgi:hypothetical protein
MENVAERAPRRFRLYGLVGLAVIVAAEVLLWSGNWFVATFFTPIVWTGYIIFVDALVAMRTGSSPLSSRRRELALLVPISIVSWYIFEGVNLLLRNWTYVNLPPTRPERWLGYAWSYGTITPAIFITAELIRSLFGGRLEGRRKIFFGPAAERAFFYVGFLLFVVVLVFPSPYLCPLPWISVLLWFEGMNDRLRIGSFSEQFRSGDYGLFVSLLISGAVCGLLWESWNFGALTKWHYNVPYLPDVKLFEMPVLGYLGFPPFALECFLLYRFFRFVIPAARARDVLGLDWDPRLPGGSR